MKPTFVEVRLRLDDAKSLLAHEEWVIGDYGRSVEDGSCARIAKALRASINEGRDA